MTSRAMFGVIALAFLFAGVFHGVALRGFVVLFAILTAQQLYSHATYMLTTWRDERRVDWASAVVLLAMPLVLVLLARDGARRPR
jgi:hypothetical protein